MCSFNSPSILQGGWLLIHVVCSFQTAKLTVRSAAEYDSDAGEVAAGGFDVSAPDSEEEDSDSDSCNHSKFQKKWIQYVFQLFPLHRQLPLPPQNSNHTIPIYQSNIQNHEDDGNTARPSSGSNGDASRVPLNLKRSLEHRQWIQVAMGGYRRKFPL